MAEHENISGFSFQEKLKSYILNEKFNPQITTIRILFSKIRATSSKIQESAEETSPSPPSSYAPVVIKKYRIPLLTKFVILKLKIDIFSVSIIFLKSALRWKLSVVCFVERSLHSPP